jgi:hypothetical protein
VVLTVAEALAWYLIHPYDERNLYLALRVLRAHVLPWGGVRWISGY